MGWIILPGIGTHRQLVRFPPAAAHQTIKLIKLPTQRFSLSRNSLLLSTGKSRSKGLLLPGCPNLNRPARTWRMLKNSVISWDGSLTNVLAPMNTNEHRFFNRPKVRAGRLRLATRHKQSFDGLGRCY